MLAIDKEYEEAIRFYLDKGFFNSTAVQGSETQELHVIRPYKRYVEGLAEENYIFSSPVYGWWDLTSACNFRCIHCLYNDTEYSSKNDLSHTEAVNLANDLVERGLIEIILTGGEVFKRPDTMSIVKLFKENNVAVKLLTNSSIMTDKHIDELAELFNPYLDTVQISLDGATNETFKKIRRTDLFPVILKNIEKLTRKGVRVGVSYTVNKINYHEVEDTYNLVSSIGVSDFMLGKVMYYNESHESLLVPNRDLILLYQRISGIQNGKTKLVAGLFPTVELLGIPEVQSILEEDKYQNLLKKFSKPMSKTCHNHDRIRICSNGDMYLCLEADSCPEAKLGNYKENSFDEIWEKRLSNIFYQERPQEKMICKDCKYTIICNSGCPVKAYKRTGNILAPECKCYMS